MLFMEEKIIAIALKDKDDSLYNVSYKKGLKKELIEFFNNNYYIYLIDAGRDKNKVAINLNYNIKENVNNLNDWKTLDQLIDENLIIIKGNK